MTPDFFPDDRYYCLLDEQPDYLVPQHAVLQRQGEGPLIINPHAWFAWTSPPMADMTSRIGSTEGLYETPWTVWVEDPSTRTIMPYWLGPELAHLLVDKRPGDVLADRPREDLLAILWQAEIVVTPDHWVRRNTAWSAQAQAAAAQAPLGWAVLERLLPAFHVGALRRYLRRQIRHGRLTLGDGQSPQRYAAYNEPVAAFFHRQLCAAISDAAGTALRPSYSYVTAYQGGAELEPHTDREQCEYTVSLCADATPEPEAQVPWPLCLQTHQGPIAVFQHLGDGLLFRGRHLPHWRDHLAQDATASSVLFHYVDATFAGELH